MVRRPLVIQLQQMGAVPPVISLWALPLGFLLDLLLGDPPRLPHIVAAMGKVILWMEGGLRRIFPQTAAGELCGGTFTALLPPLFWTALAWGLLHCCGLIHPLARLAVESLLCWQCLALRSMIESSRQVFTALTKGDLPAARLSVSRIVGRDTAALDAAGVTRAAVESVAENTTDGVIAPLLFLLAGGAPLGLFYKAINTADSMIGYKSKPYLYFGRAAAILDDIANYIPARIAALLMVPAACILRLDGRGAWRIFRRDRYNHDSPNSAQTEAACAGALHLQLGGSADYFGETHFRPTLGDDTCPPGPDHIIQANRMLCGSSLICLLLGLALKGLILWS